MAENKMRIVVDDGSQRVPIENAFGDEIGVIYFRPTDVGIIKRFNEVAEQFNDIVKPLEDISINADGTTDESNEAWLNALTEAQERLYKTVDYMLGGDASSALFGKMNPFSPVNGTFYCEIALNAIGAYINNQFEAQTKTFESHVSKYTKKYTGKGKK